MSMDWARFFCKCLLLFGCKLIKLMYYYCSITFSSAYYSSPIQIIHTHTCMHTEILWQLSFEQTWDAKGWGWEEQNQVEENATWKWSFQLTSKPLQGTHEIYSIISPVLQYSASDSKGCYCDVYLF